MNVKYLVGIDEAGRGPLAGPVAVGAVAVSCDFDFASVAGIKDSKKLSSAARDAWYGRLETLRSHGKLDFAVAFSSAYYIDRFGIVPAIRSALARALKALTEGTREADSQYRVLLDGSLEAPPEFTNQTTIIRGDESEPIISLASVAAKVTRDRLMARLASDYPAYDFKAHKGYGTLAHREAIRKFGLSALHRKTFCSRLPIGSKPV